MTDDEINRRVAEIEGWVSEPSPTGRFAWMKHPIHGIPPNRMSADDKPPPYATDWTWCGPLVEKYLVCMTHRGEQWYTDTYDGPDACDSSPKRAICLAVIAAHEDKPSVVWTGLGEK